MHRPAYHLRGGRSGLLADLNALALYALLLGAFSLIVGGALIARPASTEPTDSGRADADSAATAAAHTSGRRS